MDGMRKKMTTKELAAEVTASINAMDPKERKAGVKWIKSLPGFKETLARYDSMSRMRNR
jgi:hypothetical protein